MVPNSVNRWDDMDDRTRANVQEIMKLVVSDDWDWLLVIDGAERVGKTTLAQQIQLTAEPYLNDLIMSGDYDKALDRCAFTFDGMVEKIKTVPPGTTLAYHEASMLGREAMYKHNLRMIRVMTTIGNRNLFHLWTFPDFYMLDPYLRDGRCRTRAYVFTSRRKRGYVNWYVAKRFPFPRASGETVWFQLAYTSRFYSIPSISKYHAEYWARFEELDFEAKNRILEGKTSDTRREITMRLRKNGLTVSQIAEVVGMSVSWVSSVLRDPESYPSTPQPLSHP